MSAMAQVLKKVIQELVTTKTCSRALFEKRCSACEACCIAGWTIARTSSGLRQNSTHAHLLRTGNKEDKGLIAQQLLFPRLHNRSIANCRSMMRRAKIKTSTRKHPFTFELNGRAIQFKFNGETSIQIFSLQNCF